MNIQTCMAAAALVFGALVLAAPDAAAAGFASGAALCMNSVLPALFPFFAVCELLTAAPPPAGLLRPVQKVLGFSSAEAARALLLSWVGGYAVCARLAGQLYAAGRISRRDALLLQLLGCCSGPGFVIGCVGGQLLGNVRLGVLLYAAQIAANLAAGAVCAALCPTPQTCGGTLAPTAAAGEAVPVSLPQAISAAVLSSLSVCGCVVFFRLTGAVLLAVLPLPPLAVSTALEVSAGCADFAARGGSAALYGCCACLSLLGVSVWAQMHLFAGDAFCPRLLLAGRGLHFLFLQLLIRLCVRLLPGSVTACSTLAARVVPVLRLPPDAAAAGFVFLCAALYKAGQNLYNK